MDKWKPINYEGVIYRDPREELLARAARAKQGNDTYVAIPIKLAIACGNIRECGVRTTISRDEDGPFSKPIEIQCSKPRGHEHAHYNGYTNWK